jgi:hypothetical protein
MRRDRKVAVLAVAILLCLGLTGCTGSGDPAPSPAPTSLTSQERALRSLWSAQAPGFTAVLTTGELARSSALVVSGVIAGVAAGRSTAEDGPASGVPRTLVLTISLPRIAAGRVEGNTNGNIYVELPAPRPGESGAVPRAFPVGSVVVAYLRLAANGSGVSRLPRQNEGRPAGLPLYTPTNPQGLVLRLVVDHRFTWPLARHPSVAARLVDVLPGGEVILGP